MRAAVAPDGPSATVAGRFTRVLGPQAERHSLPALAERADAAVQAVSSVLPSQTPQPVLVVLPAGAAGFSRLTATATGVPAAEAGGDVPAGTAAVAVAVTGRDGRDGDPEQWVVVNPAVFPRLSAEGTAAVLAHEITHVAVREFTTERTPGWLVEGLGDFVAYRRSGQRPPEIAAELAADVRAGYRPRSLPSDAALSQESAGAPRAYAESWLACRYVAERAGVPALIRLYRLAGADQDGSAGATDAVERVLGMDSASFTRAWARYVVRELT